MKMARFAGWKGLVLCAFLGLCVLSAGCRQGLQQNSGPESTGTSMGPYVMEDYPDTPEGVLRDFYVAMVEQDAAKIRRLIVPHENAEVLWSGPGYTADQREEWKQRFQTMTFRRLSAGDKVEIAQGQTMEVLEPMVGPNKKLLLPQVKGGQYTNPLFVVRRGGEWKVDASILIEGRSR